MKLAVNVTQEHINQVRRTCSFSACPIAVALNEQHPCPSVPWWVGDLVASGGPGRYRLPSSARAFVSAFDADEDVAPFAFELEAWD